MSGVALVTGGQQGIGLGIAKHLVDSGFRVAIASRSESSKPSVSSALRFLGPRARYYQHDVSDIDAVPVLLDVIEAELGPITTLVNNAGVTRDNLTYILDPRQGDIPVPVHPGVVVTVAVRATAEIRQCGRTAIDDNRQGQLHRAQGTKAGTTGAGHAFLLGHAQG